ncbi:MAG: hypothetical protein OWU33_04660, partial [Firmicutes bacterium]|nr:hypothetical protein [Bacillota bacterium]
PIKQRPPPVRTPVLPAVEVGSILRLRFGREPMKRRKSGKARMPLNGALHGMRDDHRDHVV